MKLSLLNAGHSVIGILGAFIGYDTIDEAVNNQYIRAFLNAYLDVEVTPVLGELKGIDLKTYKKSLLERFGNTNIKIK
jgi:mannitol 2-dehydrogenase